MRTRSRIGQISYTMLADSWLKDLLSSWPLLSNWKRSWPSAPTEVCFRPNWAVDLIHCGLASAQVTALGSTTRRDRQMPTGTVKFFNESKGFGFIQPEGGGPDAFVHISDVERSGMSTLRENQRVSYDVEQDQRGKMKATNLKSADGE